MQIQLNNQPGAYVIECLANSACYVGGTTNVKQRVMSHLANLRADHHDIPLLQADWKKYGSNQFVIWVQYSVDPEDLEKNACLILNGLEEAGGYTKSLVRKRGLSARIRDSERKYLRRGKFCRITPMNEHQRINPEYIRTFCQGNLPMRQRTETQSVISAVEGNFLRTKLLSGFIRLDAAIFDSKKSDQAAR